MRKVSISEIKPGERVEKSIYLNFGCLYLPKGAVVEEKTINRLKNIGIEEVFISEEESPEEELMDYHDKEEAKKSYNLCLESTQELMEKIHEKRYSTIQEINKTIDLIIREILSKSDILVRMIEMKKQDSCLYCHSMNVCILAAMVGKWMGYSGKKLYQLITAGLLHDIGMTHVYSKLTGDVSQLENDIKEDKIKEHTIYGYDAVNKIRGIDRSVCQAILLHHERSDGSGYPFGLHNENIPNFAKIVSVIDTYDNLIWDKERGMADNPYLIVEKIKNDGFTTLDPEIVYVFTRNICDFFIGNVVKLSNGKVGRIVQSNTVRPSKPVVQMGSEYIDLEKNPSITIERVII